MAFSSAISALGSYVAATRLSSYVAATRLKVRRFRRTGRHAMRGKVARTTP